MMNPPQQYIIDLEAMLRWERVSAAAEQALHEAAEMELLIARTRMTTLNVEVISLRAELAQAQAEIVRLSAIAPTAFSPRGEKWQ